MSGASTGSAGGAGAAKPGTVPKLPSGKHTKNYGKPPFLMGKFTINGDFP